MATESAPQANAQGEGQTPDPQAPTSSSEGNGEQQGQQAPATVVIDKDTKLPDDHPLIVKHGELKAKLSTANTELAEARSQSAKATQLQEELDKRPTTEALTTLQTRYDRLEAFTQAIGLGKALDSRTFTRDLFETDKPVADLVKEWNKANPTATSRALGSGAGDEGSSKPSINDLLRAAAPK